MEKDFMGIGGNASASAFSVMQWPFSNNPSSMQQLKPFKTQPDKKHKSPLFDLIPSSSKACDVQSPQISLGVDRHNVQQFAIHNHQNQDIDNNISVPVMQTNVPVGMSSSLLRIHGSSNGFNLPVTAVKSQPFQSILANNSSLHFSPRNVVKSPSTTTQLTIFYAGSVNVYDDVSWDKAQAVILKASEACKATTNVHSIVEAPSPPLNKGPLSDSLRVSQTQKTVNNHVVSSCSSLSSALSLASHIGNQSESCSVITDDKVGAKRPGTSQEETSITMNSSMVATTDAATNMPSAVPQARKASLARFLEKRKERVSSTIPYSFEKKSYKTTHDPVVPFSDFSWFEGQGKNCDDNGDSPSTKLEM